MEIHVLTIAVFAVVTLGGGAVIARIGHNRRRQRDENACWTDVHYRYVLFQQQGQGQGRGKE